MKTPKQNSIRTTRELGKKLDVSASVICDYCKRPEWPFARRGPWPMSDIPNMLRWRAEVLARHKDDHVATGEIGELRKTKLKQEIRKLTAQADVAEREFAILEERYGSREEFHRDTIKGLTISRNAIMQIPYKLSLVCANASAADVMEYADREIRQILEDLSASFQKYADDHDQNDQPLKGESK